MSCLHPFRLLFFLACLMPLLGGNALAGLDAVGPTNPVTTLPTWYMDPAGLPLAPCVDQNGFCILPPPFDPALPDVNFPVLEPITTTGPVNDTNFPDEAFYYSAFVGPTDGVAGGTFDIDTDPLLNPPLPGNTKGPGDRVVFGYVLEFAFLSGVAPDTAITFLRTDLQKMDNLFPNATYRVTHPYGQFEFQTDAAGTTVDAGPGLRFEDQSGSVANWLTANLKGAPKTNIGPYLIPADVAGGTPLPYLTDPADPDKQYLGDAFTPAHVTGSPTGNNFVLIERLDPTTGATVVSWRSDYFVLMGRVYTDQIPSPLAVHKTTYATDGTNGQLDLFVTALPNATLTLSGTGVPAMTFIQDVPNTGRFYAHAPISGAIPTDLVVNNSLDIPALPFPVVPVDEVIISLAQFDPQTQNLTIKAASRDTSGPPPTLTSPTFAGPANVLDSTGTLVVNLTGTIPPLRVQVVSSNGGLATAKVSVNDGSITANTGGVSR